VIKAAGAYVCGEETALLNSIEGKRGEVRTRPPYPAQQGLFNRPTVVNNVETLACVPWVVANGGAAFAKLGSEKSNGSKLVCLDSGFKRPGMYEVECGNRCAKVIDELGGGFSRPTKALHIGGPLGGIVPLHKINALSIDFESFQKEGFLLGHASVLSIPQDFPMVEYLEHLFEFTSLESCGKCFPCRIGSTRGKELIVGAKHRSQDRSRALQRPDRDHGDRLLVRAGRRTAAGREERVAVFPRGTRRVLRVNGLGCWFSLFSDGLTRIALLPASG
jgi:NADH-quinone oxidoreductase subunit F